MKKYIDPDKELINDFIDYVVNEVSLESVTTKALKSYVDDYIKHKEKTDYDLESEYSNCFKQISDRVWNV